MLREDKEEADNLPSSGFIDKNFSHHRLYKNISYTLLIIPKLMPISY
ncbi:hypothetical protein SIN_0337 [Streptococcus infantis SK1302]|uniref:Uncharacterized protein n=1 Tax=Streptococcus infantis SK1302 TaxID=871237 RepID=A0ABP2J508_9STRE|nr:hypothetical protein SIN_0337 [Streptococcus infantis SK1302]